MLANGRFTAVVPVTDLAKAREFYEGVMGLSVERDDSGRGGVTYVGGGTSLLVYERATATSGEHTALAIDFKGDDNAVYNGLIEKGVTFDTFDAGFGEWDDRGVLRTDSGTAAWFKDPFGNVININQLAFS